jgi:DNA-directed RNA polymerase specialized sigma24 family protein
MLAAIADAPVGPAEALDGQGKIFAAILGLTSGLEISSRSSARSLRRARPGGSVTACCDPDQKTLQAALKGDMEAAAAFTRAAADLVWNACQRVTRSEAETEEAFREVMAALRADGFARLKGYDGRARVRVYLALVVRDLLVERILRLLALDAERGWRAFEAFFAEDMRRMILRMLSGTDQEQNREDAYQSVCEALVKNDLQRLRAYSGRGSPSGFILHIIENLVIDYVRTIVPRRRLPAAIARLAALDQSIFRLLYWERLAPDPVLLLVYLPREKAPPTAPSSPRQWPAFVRHFPAAITRRRRLGPSIFRRPTSGASPAVPKVSSCRPPNNNWSRGRRPACSMRRSPPYSRRCLGSRLPNAYTCNWRSPVSRRAKSPLCSVCRSGKCTSSRKG